MSSSKSKLSYLQKYLSEGDQVNQAHLPKDMKKKKKKKKKDKSHSKTREDFVKRYTSRIIDDDEAFAAAADRDNKDKDEDSDAEAEARYGTREDRPQVAGVVDDRPEVVIMRERFTTTSFRPLIKEEIKEEPRSDDDAEDVPRRRRLDSGSSNDGDASPPRRRRRHDSSDDDAPRQKRHSSSDASPPRRRRRHSSSSDASPPRRARESRSDLSPPRFKEEPRSDGEEEHRRGGDLSPPRRKRQNPEVEVKREPVSEDGDLSPPRPKRTREGGRDEGDLSPPRRRRLPSVKREAADSEGDLSPPRMSSSSTKGLMSKTLDGKRAGLQDARALKTELDDLRRKDRSKFDEISAELTGRGAETVVRGRLKAKEEERKRKQEENEITDQVKDKYSRWSKGLKQQERIQERIAEDLHEMDKPLARAADDEDLEEHLRKQEREEDPMLEYMRKKKQKKLVAAGAKQMPQYQGPPPAPNRFGIRPGYRWDGVDRSNGFERKLFNRQNEMKALKSDAYKWSTEDM